MTAVLRGSVAFLSMTLLGCSGHGGGSRPLPPPGDAGSEAGGSVSDARESADASRPAGDGSGGGRDGGASSVGDGNPSNPDATPGGPRPGYTPGGVAVPAGWTLKRWDRFGTGAGSTVTTVAELHARYFEGMYYNRDAKGLAKIPNTVINGEQQTYVHFETAIAWSPDHLTIQARGRPDGSITSGELVSVYTARAFCIEARYRIPGQAGSWPAFWFYGATTGGDKSEIDVEQPITPNQKASSVSLYNHPSQGTIVIADPAFTTKWMTWTKASFDASTAPHTYTVCYDDAASSVTRHIDGALIYTATFKWNASLGGTGKGPDASTIVNLAVGGGWPGNVANPGAFAADLDLHWIAYYGP